MPKTAAATMSSSPLHSWQRRGRPRRGRATDPAPLPGMSERAPEIAQTKPSPTCSWAREGNPVMSYY
ncbi:hypothetical protein GQ600_10909 [Phytophthora cactorum]|nr:hypothetical protein GQ600_10909 [Phytophthora cactorum]